MTELRLSIDGMSCGHCVATVRNALAAVPGVTVTDVGIGNATVSLDERHADVAAVIDAVQDVGYEAREES